MDQKLQSAFFVHEFHYEAEFFFFFLYTPQCLTTLRGDSHCPEMGFQHWHSNGENDFFSNTQFSLPLCMRNMLPLTTAKQNKPKKITDMHSYCWLGQAHQEDTCYRSAVSGKRHKTVNLNLSTLSCLPLTDEISFKFPINSEMLK